MIIGLTGNLQSGKDTIADHLVEKYEFRKVGFSDVMYEAICNLFDMSLEEALDYKDPEQAVTVLITGIDEDIEVDYNEYTWRMFLQRFGTQMGRKTFGEDFWCEQFARKYLMIPQRLVVRDVRFNNEAALLNDQGGTIWKVMRPGFVGDSHISEAGIHEGYVEAEIMNDGTVEDLYELIDKAMTEVYGFDG